jgi:hypothetical protein
MILAVSTAISVRGSMAANIQEGPGARYIITEIAQGNTLVEIGGATNGWCDAEDECDNNNSPVVYYWHGFWNFNGDITHCAFDC